eukprot:12656226-Heterocapsa_arctica.AAC.1
MSHRARHPAGRSADGGPRRSSLGSLHRAGKQTWTMVGTANMDPKPGLRAAPTSGRASCSKLGRVA